MQSVSVFVSVLPIPPMSLGSLVFVPPLFVSLLLLIFVIAAVPVMVFMVRAAPVTSVISGRGSAAVPAPVRGVAPQAPSCGGESGSGLTGAPLQAGGAQSVEEEALVGAPQGTLQPDRRQQTNSFTLTSDSLDLFHSGFPSGILGSLANLEGVLSF